MEDNLINSVFELYERKRWRDIINKYHSHPERSKLLWVFPSEDNLQFLKRELDELRCDGVLSVGCGSGLLEWIVGEATGFPVTGIEVDRAWWCSKYAPRTFIPLHFTRNPLDGETIDLLRRSHSKALLFCYFNNRDAFEKYLCEYTGTALIIIGPHGKGVHTDPKPFGDVSDKWVLFRSQEVRSSKDFIAVYRRA